MLDERIAAAGRPDVGRRAGRRGPRAGAGAGCARAGRPAGRSATSRCCACSPVSCTEAQAHDETVRATRRFVRRQRSWFRRDPRIHWLDSATPDARRRRAARRSAEIGDDGGVEFTKGHGTGNDFVILPDPDGAARPDARPGRRALRPAPRHRRATGCCGWCAPPSTPTAPALGRRRPSGSWTTGTPTARSPRCAATGCGSSSATCSTTGLATPTGAACRWPPGPASCARWSTATPIVRRDAPPPGVRQRRTATLGGLTLPGAAVDVGNPHLVCALPAGADLAALDLTRAPGFDPPVFPARGQRRVHRARRPGRRRRRARADAGLRARLGRDPVLRHRRLRGGRRGAARRRPGHRQWSRSTCPAAGSR